MKSSQSTTEFLDIGLASPEKIKQWAEKILPNGKVFGEVTSPRTVDYKTLKPVKEGLFCEKIFGPVEDFTCSCGKKPDQDQKFCNECDVEYTSSKVRRYRLGYIKLGSPVGHIWFFKGRKNYISILLGIRRKKVDAFLYGTRITHTMNFFENGTHTLFSKKEKHNFDKGHFTGVNKLSTLVHTKKTYQYDLPGNGTTKLVYKTDKLGNSIAFFKINKSETYNFFFTLPANFPFSWHSEHDAEKFLKFFTGSRLSLYQGEQKQNPSKQEFSSKLPLAANSISSESTNKVGKLLPTESQNDADWLTNFVSTPFPLFSNTLKKNKNQATSQKLFFKRKRIQKKSLTSDYFFEQESTTHIRKSESFPNTENLNDFLKNITKQDTIPGFFHRQNSIGGELFRQILSSLDLPVLKTILRIQIPPLTEQILLRRQYVFDIQKNIPDHYSRTKYEKRQIREYKEIKQGRLNILKQLKVVQDLLYTKQKPEWLIISNLPVLPPSLRPILQLDGGEVALSDLTKLYQRILYRNKRFGQKSFDTRLSMYTQRLLQEAVNDLIENGKSGGEPACASNGRPLKSLSDILKGKKGRFRQNLLGKRVDYSGRSVIVVGPQLKIHECGLPKEMALELFQPFLIRQLVTHKVVRRILEAKKLIAQQSSIIWEVLEHLLEDHVIILNRAPTLHRLGIQAFQPKLVNGRAILLHPLVCTGFNADFDGDQMAVHIPLSYQARAEAWQLIWSRNNILSPATGQPILLPSQDMVLGCYYLTTENSRKQKSSTFCFSSFQEARVAFTKNIFDLHSFLWIQYFGEIETGNKKNEPLEIRIDSYGNSLQIYENAQYFLGFDGFQKNQKVRTTLGRILFNEVVENFLQFR